VDELGTCVVEPGEPDVDAVAAVIGDVQDPELAAPRERPMAVGAAFGAAGPVECCRLEHREAPMTAVATVRAVVDDAWDWYSAMSPYEQCVDYLAGDPDIEQVLAKDLSYCDGLWGSPESE